MERKPLKCITILEGTKISLDMKSGRTYDYQKMYRKKIEGSLPGVNIAVPARMNRLIIIDVDTPRPNNKSDGRLWIKENQDRYPDFMQTFRVETPSGGTHFYFFTPLHLDVKAFTPKRCLAKGVDIIWNGYVVAPPTKGYDMVGTFKDIKDISPELLTLCEHKEKKPPTFNITDEYKINVPLHPDRVKALLSKLKMLMPSKELDYHKWLYGILSIRSAVEDEELRKLCLEAWTLNKSYKEGDIDKAIDISESSDPHGGIGAGTILSFLDEWTIPKKSDLKDEILMGDILAHPHIRMAKGKNGREIILPTESNCACVIETLLPNGYLEYNRLERGESLYLDERKQVIMHNGSPIRGGIEKMGFKLLRRIQQDFGLAHLKKAQVIGGLEMVLIDRAVDPLLLWINELKWDGVPRIESFFTEYCTCKEDPKYLANVALTLWRSLVYRIMNPGHKADEVVVLQGVEGIFKTSLASIMAKGYFFACSDRSAFVNRDELLNMHRAAVVELEELIPLVKCDPDSAKGFITRTMDVTRKMFGRQSEDSPRSFILLGTTNRQYFINPALGKRRFLPVSVDGKSAIKLSAVAADIDQFYAEAAEHWRQRKPNHGLINFDEKAKALTRFETTDALDTAIDDVLSEVDSIQIHNLYIRLKHKGVVGNAGLTQKRHTQLTEHLYKRGWQLDGKDWMRPKFSWEDRL